MNEFISNLFQTNPQKPGPPLLGFYILWILRGRCTMRAIIKMRMSRRLTGQCQTWCNSSKDVG